MPDHTTLYCQSARFASKAAAEAVYLPLQSLVFEEQTKCELSVYRLKITEGWHVVVLGERPPAVVQEQIEALLTQGTLVNLPHDRPDVVVYLQTRRAQATHLAPWVEGHYHTSEE